jgi:hypothetical protein
MERLLAAGALDVTLTPVLMKKNRPATQLSVIAGIDSTEQLVQILFAETSTLGVRIVEAQRRVLEREISEVETSFGRVRVKTNSSGSFAPEFDDCRRLALEHQVPLKAVFAEVLKHSK